MRFNILSYFPSPNFLSMPSFGIDIGSKSIQVIELKQSNGKIKLGRFGERFLETPITDFRTISENTELKKVIESLEREFQLRFVRVSLPEEISYLFTTTVEMGSEETIRRDIEFHLEENVPISGEEAVFDYHIFRFLGNNEVEAIVTVLPRKIIESYITLFESCGITILSFLLEPTAVSRSVVKKGDNAAYLVVNLKDTQTGISIVSEGAPQFTSTVS